MPNCAKVRLAFKRYIAMIRLLLLSDIHYLSLPSEMDPDSKMRKVFLKDLADFYMANGTFDHILVGGDIANTGNVVEYDRALLFFQEICEATGCPKEQIYVVAGNHDKDFKAENAELRHIIHAGFSNPDVDSDKFFCDLLKNDFAQFRAFYQPFKAYGDFAFKIDSSEPLMMKCHGSDESPYNSEQDKAFLKAHLNNIEGVPVFLYAMNTSLISDWYDINDYDKGHKLFLPKLSYNANADTEEAINIVMMHHPVDRLSHAEEIKSVLDENYQVQIFGHLHKPASICGNNICIHSGALQPPKYEGDTSENYFSVFNIIELDIVHKESRSFLNVVLRVQKYDNNRFIELAEESKTFEVELKKHINRWEKGKEEVLPEGVTIKKIRYAFLNQPNPKACINKMSVYDESKSHPQNCVEFLQKMEAEHKMTELWDFLNS